VRLFTTIVSLVFLSLLGMQTASAASVTATWAVSDAVGPTNPHGLWTNGLELGASGSSEQKKRYSFNSGSSLTEYDDGTAHLTATATNPDNFTATIDMWFGGYATTYPEVKIGGGSDTSDWHFYSTVTEGSTITIEATTYYLGMVMLGQGPVLQIGTGANDKTLVFGASTWLDIFSDQARTNKLFGNAHWDLNMNLTAVPIPAAIWLFGSAMIGLVGMRRKNKLAA